MANSYLRFNQPNSMFAAMSFGNCGYALPAIIGAKVAAPDRPAVAYVGDGAWGMSFNEILTCVREDIPVTAVVFHNKQWGAEKKNQVDFYDTRFLGVNLENPSLAEVARAMGARGVTVHELDEVGAELTRACEAQKRGKTTVIEVMCTMELGDPFRRDALKYPTACSRNTGTPMSRRRLEAGGILLLRIGRAVGRHPRGDGGGTRHRRGGARLFGLRLFGACWYRAGRWSPTRHGRWWWRSSSR